MYDIFTDQKSRFAAICRYYDEAGKKNVWTSLIAT
jgi:hypothetical protein